MNLDCTLEMKKFGKKFEKHFTQEKVETHITQEKWEKSFFRASLKVVFTTSPNAKPASLVIPAREVTTSWDLKHWLLRMPERIIFFLHF